MSLNGKVSCGDEIQYQNFKYFIIGEQKLTQEREFNENSWITGSQQTEKYGGISIIIKLVHPWEGLTSLTGICLDWKIPFLKLREQVLGSMALWCQVIPCACSADIEI